MLWGIGTPTYWGDEVDTVSAVSRSLPQLLRMLGHVDAVHGLYYGLLWAMARLAGTGEFATRLPSAIAIAASCFGLCAIARRLHSRRAAVYAGLVFAVLPAVTQQGHDARPYAMVTGAVVLSSYLLVRAADDPRPGRFAAYGAALALVGYLQMFGLLIVAAHAITLIVRGIGAGRRRTDGPSAGARHRRVLAGWLAATLSAAVISVPVVVFGWFQRGAIAWIKHPGWPDLRQLLAFVSGGSLLSAAAMAMLAVAGLKRADDRRPGGWQRPLWSGLRLRRGPLSPATLARLLRGLRGSIFAPRPVTADRRLGWLALPWLAVPPAILWAVSLAHPVYSVRYVTFCLPAGALLAGAGLARLNGRLAALALALIAALSVPGQLAVRVPGGGTGPAAMQAASLLLAAHERPGDAIVYPGGGIPPWNVGYPQGFGGLRDLSLAETGAAAGHLYGVPVPVRTLQERERGVRRIWVAELGPPWRNPGPYIISGFRLAADWQLERGLARIWLYTRSGPA